MFARTSLLSPSTSFPLALVGAPALLRLGQKLAPNAAQRILALPFDALRQHYARAVLADLVPRSILDSARMERWLDALEALTLGPLARVR